MIYAIVTHPVQDYATWKPVSARTHERRRCACASYGGDLYGSILRVRRHTTWRPIPKNATGNSAGGIGALKNDQAAFRRCTKPFT